METPTSLPLQLDKITRAYSRLLQTSCEEEFLKYLSALETIRSQCLATEKECRELREKLDSAVKDISVLEYKLSSARRWINEEIQERIKVTRERDILCQQLNAVRKILLKDHYAVLPENAKKELIFLESTTRTSDYVDAESGDRSERFNFSPVLNKDLDAGTFSPKCTPTEEKSDLDIDVLSLSARNTPAKYSSFVKDLNGVTGAELLVTPSTVRTPIATKSLRVCDEFVGSANKRSVPEIFSPCPTNSRSRNLISPAVLMKSSTATTPTCIDANKRHNFISRTFMMPESCTRCYRKIAFGGTVLKCTGCAIVIHPECRDDVLSACKSYLNFSRIRKMGLLTDYLKHTLPPFVPGVVVDIVREIERRGLQDEKLYRMQGTKSLVQRLLEDVRCNKEVKSKFINYDTHSICCALMNFFENLREPLIPCANWNTFSEAVSTSGKRDCDLILAISSLPLVNRDTLAFLVLHLQNVVTESSCNAEDLAVVFCSVIFGLDGREVDYTETVVRELILLPDVYWKRFVSATSLIFTSTPLKNNGGEKESMYFSPTMAMTTPRKRFFNTEPLM